MPTTSTPRNRVEQSGTITHDHLVSWVADGVIKDSGISAIPSGGGGGGGGSSSLLPDPNMAWSGPTSGLTHRWSMKDADMAGSSVLDLVGTLNGAIDTNKVTTGPGCSPRFATARKFIGDGCINLASSPITVGGTWTVAGWYRCWDAFGQSLDGFSQTLFFFNDGVNFLRIFIDGTNEAGVIQISNLAALTSSAGAVLMHGTWVHVAIRYDGIGTYRISKNGVTVAMAAGIDAAATDTSNSLGGRGTTRFFRGQMNDVCTYNRELSDGEIVTLFNAGSVLGGANIKTLDVVTDLGAAGDDVQDDTHFINWGVQAGCGRQITVKVPFGTYKIFPITSAPWSHREMGCVYFGYSNVKMELDGVLKQYTYDGNDPVTVWSTLNPAGEAGGPGQISRGMGIYFTGSGSDQRANCHVIGIGGLNGQCPVEDGTWPLYSQTPPPTGLNNGHGWDTTHHAMFWEDGISASNFQIRDLDIGFYRGELTLSQGQATADVIFDNLTLHDTMANADNISGPRHVMRNCHIYRCDNGATEWSSLQEGCDGTFHDNYVHDCVHGFVTANSGFFTALCGVTRIYNNRIERCGGDAVFTNIFARRVEIFDNWITDGGFTANITIACQNDTFPPGVDHEIIVRNNTMEADHWNGMPWGILVGNEIDSGGIIVENNRFKQSNFAIVNGNIIGTGIKCDTQHVTGRLYAVSVRDNDLRNCTNTFIDLSFGTQEIQALRNITGEADNNLFRAAADDGTTFTAPMRYGDRYVIYAQMPAGNRTFSAPTGLIDSQTYKIVIKQDNVGNRLITAWDTIFRFPAGVAPTLSTAANAVDIVEGVYDATSTKLRMHSFVANV